MDDEVPKANPEFVLFDRLDGAGLGWPNVKDEVGGVGEEFALKLNPNPPDGAVGCG